MSSTTDSAVDAHPGSAPKRDRTHYLYIAVIVAVVAGILVGWPCPEVGKSSSPSGTGFVNLIKMMITPIIFCTIVLGIGSVRKAAQVGKVGGLALGYFIVMSTVALAHRAGRRQPHPARRGPATSPPPSPRPARRRSPRAPSEPVDFILGIIPTTLVSAADRRARCCRPCSSRCSSASPLQAHGPRPASRSCAASGTSSGSSSASGDDHVGRPDRRVRCHRRRRRRHRLDALKSLGLLMVAFYVTCAIFVFVVLGTHPAARHRASTSSRCCATSAASSC